MMQIEKDRLYEIILEEYLLAEGHAGTEAAEELLKRIMGDKYRPPEERDPARYAKHHGDTEPMEKPHAPEEEDEDLTGVVDAGETYPIDPEGDETPFRVRQSLSPDSLADAIGELIHGRDPEEVAEIFETVYLVQEEPASSILQLVRNKEADDIQEIFQLAFEKLPGVELSSPGDEDYPGEETLYSPGAEGRPVAGFQLENLMELIREVLDEGHYHDMGDEPQQDQADQESGYKSQLKQIIKEELARVLKENQGNKENLLDGIRQTYIRIEKLQGPGIYGRHGGGIDEFMKRIVDLDEETLKALLTSGQKFLAKKVGLPV
jgi:hypothetical protein